MGDGSAEAPLLSLRSPVLQLLASGSFDNLITTCEECELAIQTELTDTPSAEEVGQVGVLYAAHLLAYLHEGQLLAARFLWKRTPAPVQEHPQALAAHRMLVASWTRQPAEFFREVRECAWGAELQPLASAVESRRRAELLDRIGDAYKAISVERIASMVGLDAAAVTAECGKRGWAVDNSGMAMPEKTRTSEDQMRMGEEQLQKLAEYVAFLEQPQSSSM